MSITIRRGLLRSGHYISLHHPTASAFHLETDGKIAKSTRYDGAVLARISLSSSIAGGKKRHPKSLPRFIVCHSRGEVGPGKKKLMTQHNELSAVKSARRQTHNFPSTSVGSVRVSSFPSRGANGFHRRRQNFFKDSQIFAFIKNFLR